jgi:large subunit ribosomal protein L15
MQLNTLKRKNPNKKARQVGRGGTRGKTSGRGGKGQTARAGNKRRPQMRDIIKKIPKLRGYRFNSFKTKFSIVNLSDLNIFETGSTVNPQSLLDLGLVKKVGGVLPKVKILGNGKIEKKISIVNCKISDNARSKIEEIGGSISK